MEAQARPSLPAQLHSLAAMAGLLERLERQPGSASAEQYRGVVRQVTGLLQQAEPGPALDLLLQHAPAAAQIYENLNYQHAGLCRSPLESSLNAEMAAQALIQRVRRGG